MLKRFIIDSIPRLNEIFMGGLREESLIHVFGQFQSGKSLLTIQLLYEMVGKGFGNSLYLDTEASIINNFSENWMDWFKERFRNEVKMTRVRVDRFSSRSRERRKTAKEVAAALIEVLSDLKIKVEENLVDRVVELLLPYIELTPMETGRNMIYVLDGVSIDLALNILNIKADIKRKGDKMDVKILEYGDVESSPLSTFIHKYKVKFMVLDSLGNLFKPIQGGLQDLPARAGLISLVLNSFMRLASRHKLIIFVLNHESRNPAKGNYTFYGGSSVGYGFKYSLYLRRLGESKRELIVYRAPHLPDGRWRIKLIIKEGGFYACEDDSKESC